MWQLAVSFSCFFLLHGTVSEEIVALFIRIHGRQCILFDSVVFPKMQRSKMEFPRYLLDCASINPKVV